MKKFLNILLLSVIICVTTEAQVLINEDAAITSLVQTHINQNKMSSIVSGWRIQLLATTDRRKVESEEARFIRNHPLIRVNWEHAKPYYKLKAGAFVNKLEATRLLKELKRNYPSALLTKSDVNVAELLD